MRLQGETRDLLLREAILPDPSGNRAQRARSEDCIWLAVEPAYHAVVHVARLRLVTLVATATLAGCGVFGGTVVEDQRPVPAGPLGPVLPPQGGVPAVECRGVPMEMCRGFGDVGDPTVVRVIVTCTSVCTPAKGDVRIDVVFASGAVASRGQGGYESAGAVPEPPIPAPEASLPPG
jgi:hypothetical protein